MISNLWHHFRRFARKLWARTALVSALAFVAPVLAQGLQILLPEAFLARVDREAVRALLDILANSMLAVTTFSLTVMVTAHLAADQVASPRAHRILREDGRTQTVLATFVGAFIFAVVSIVMLQTGVLGQEELAALYLMTLVVMGLIIITILGWIGHLSGLGSVEATTLTCPKPPRKWPTRDDASAINLSDMPPRNINSPAKMKSGIARSEILLKPEATC